MDPSAAFSTTGHRASIATDQHVQRCQPISDEVIDDGEVLQLRSCSCSQRSETAAHPPSVRAASGLLLVTRRPCVRPCVPPPPSLVHAPLLRRTMESIQSVCSFLATAAQPALPCLAPAGRPGPRLALVGVGGGGGGMPQHHPRD
jgi:hypothetical protein